MLEDLGGARKVIAVVLVHVGIAVAGWILEGHLMLQLLLV